MNDFHIACFLSAARICNFSAAAKEFSVPQQVVSRNIKQLETELGFSLFTRSGQQLSLTRGGKAFFKWVTELDEAISWGKSTFSKTEADCFVVAYSDICSVPDSLRKAAAELKINCPELTLCAATVTEIGSQLQRRQIAAGVLPAPAALEFSTQPNMVTSAPFDSAPLYLMAAPELYDEEEPAWRELAHMPLLMPEMGKNMENRILEICRNLFCAHGIEQPEVKILPNLYSVLAQCLCRCGFTLAMENPVTEGREILKKFRLKTSLDFVVLSQCIPENEMIAPLMERLGV